MKPHNFRSHGHFGLKTSLILCWVCVVVTSCNMFKNNSKSQSQAVANSFCSTMDAIVNSYPDFNAIKGELRNKDFFGTSYSLSIDTSYFVSAYVEYESDTSCDVVSYQGQSMAECTQKFNELVEQMKQCPSLRDVKYEEGPLPAVIRVDDYGNKCVFWPPNGSVVIVLATKLSGDAGYKLRFSVQRSR